LETLPITLNSSKILISLTFCHWTDGCDVISKMDAFLANHNAIRKVEFITDRRFYKEKDVVALLPLLSAANKLGLGESEETWTVFEVRRGFSM
jgi:hypothetical protein